MRAALGNLTSPDRLAFHCFGMAVAWAITGAFFVLQPAEFDPGISFPMALSPEDLERFWSADPAHSGIHLGLHIAALLAALASLLVVPTLSAVTGGEVLRWAERLAVLGVAVMALSQVRYLSLENTYVHLLSDAPAPMHEAIRMASAGFALDGYGILEWGGWVIWLPIMASALRSRGVIGPAPLLFGCIAAAAFATMIIAGVAATWLLPIAAGVGIPAFCTWWVLLGLEFRARSTAPA